MIRKSTYSQPMSSGAKAGSASDWLSYLREIRAKKVGDTKPDSTCSTASSRIQLHVQYLLQVTYVCTYHEFGSIVPSSAAMFSVGAVRHFVRRNMRQSPISGQRLAPNRQPQTLITLGPTPASHFLLTQLAIAAPPSTRRWLFQAPLQQVVCFRSICEPIIRYHFGRLYMPHCCTLEPETIHMAVIALTAESACRRRRASRQCDSETASFPSHRKHDHSRSSDSLRRLRSPFVFYIGPSLQSCYSRAPCADHLFVRH